MNLIERMFDERFLDHRRRATSYAGVVGGILATLLFAYRFFVQHRFSGDLLAVALTILVIKYVLLAWYAFKE